jgi:hypothetical protein
MRQISAEIDQANWIQGFQQRQLVAWQTRMLCSWLVKLTPDIEPDSARKFMEEAQNISLDGEGHSPPPEQSSKKTPTGKPTRKDFYDMTDEEIEQNLGQAENPDGSFEQLLQGFGKR